MNKANLDKHFLLWTLWPVVVTLFETDFHITKANTNTVYSQDRIILRNVTVIFT